VNYMLLWLNLALIFPPFDGGGLLQAFIWAKWDRPTSLKWGARLGMGGAVVVGLFALAVGKSLLLLLAMFGFFHAYQMGVMARLGLDEQGTSEPEREWWQGGGADESDEPKPGWLARRRAVRAERRAVAEAEARHALERELDRILAKVKAQGMSSLTAGEKRALKAATEFRRNERR